MINSKMHKVSKWLSFDKKFWLPLFVTMLSWFVLDRISENTERSNKLRDLKTSYLIDSYRKLSHAANKDSKVNYDIHFKNIESALSDIRLFGSDEAAEIIRTDFLSYPSDSTWKINFDPILNQIRKDLREELNF